MTKPPIVVIGSGLSGLMLARMIKLYRDPEADIIIVERDETIGGQYGSFNYNESGYFDIGMHIYYESCIPEIDRLFTELLPENEWNILEGNYKDVQGLFFNGKLQVDTPCVDLRNLPEGHWEKYASEIFLTIKNSKDKKLTPNSNAYEVLKNHFGKVIADEIFVPVLEKLYLTHPSNLDELATLFTPINRVALFEKELMQDLMKSDEIRARICYPDQFTLPLYRTNNYRGFYPKQYGMFRVLEKLKSLLESQGVRFLTSSTVSNLEVKNNLAKSITVNDKAGNTEVITVKELFWTAGLPSLANALKIDMSDMVYDRKNTESIYVNFLFDKMPLMDKLYYFYCFDKGYRTFRVTNYTSYCPDAAGERGYPVCVEFWARVDDSKADEDTVSMAKAELKSFGVIDDSYGVNFSKVEKSPGGGFPLPSVKNISNMNAINEKIKELHIKNIIPTGVLSGKNVFFIKDVLIDAYRKVTAINELQPVNK
jgi:protoporphyrinogen oxidase